MKVLHLAAGNRWTGAAAPAFAEVEALREQGVDAHYAYVGGYKLEGKLARYGFAHPVIAKAQNPISFLRTIKTLERLVSEHHFDIVHSHLTYDHALARFLGRGGVRVPIARTFHSRRTLRNEPFTRSMLRRTELIFVTNDELANAPLLQNREVTFTPPPLDTDQFTPDGPNVRSRYSIDSAAPVFVAIGKVSKGRGFEDVIETFALIRERQSGAKLLLIGHGEHRSTLEQLIASKSMTKSVIWAGYHEDDLAEHYRAGNVLLFTAAGSDEGHRAVIEAMGCGLAPASFPIEGMAGVLGSLSRRHISRSATAEELARTALDLAESGDSALRQQVIERSRFFAYRSSARRLIDAYSTVL